MCLFSYSLGRAPPDTHTHTHCFPCPSLPLWSLQSYSSSLMKYSCPLVHRDILKDHHWMPQPGASLAAYHLMSFLSPLRSYRTCCGRDFCSWRLHGRTSWNAFLLCYNLGDRLVLTVVLCHLSTLFFSYFISSLHSGSTFYAMAVLSVFSLLCRAHWKGEHH